jgi:hypothetical protein
MSIALAVTILVVLLLRPGRARVLRSERLVALVPVLDSVRALALFAIPVLAALAFVDDRASDLQTVQMSERAGAVASAARAGAVRADGSAGPARRLPRTGGEVTTTTPAAGDLPSLARTGAPVVCRNSIDPECGPFRWEPDPGTDAPVEISVTHSPLQPRVGQEVTITVHARDADARIGDVSLTYGDESVSLIPPASNVGCEVEPTGPWTPPARTPDEVVRTFSHVYTRAGDLTLAVYTASAEALDATCPPNPYASQGTVTVPIHVSPV